VKALLRDTNGNREIPLQEKITLLGRDPTCDVVINTERTSWRHVMLLHGPQGYSVEDLDSVNGTYVNGRRILQRTLLRSRDHIEIPGLHVLFLEETTGPHGTVPHHTHKPSHSTPPMQFTPPVYSDEEVGDDDALSSILTSLEVGGVGRLEVRPEAKLHAILEISQALSNTLNLTESLPRVLDRLFSIFPHADRCFILLQDPATGQLVCRASRTRPPSPSEEIALSRGILDHVLQTGRAVLSADAGHDERFNPFQSIQRYRIGAILCVPLLGQGGERLGVIQVDTRDKGHPFTEEDLEVLITASAQMARALELASWHREQIDLEAATRIQKSFLPTTRPTIEGLAFYDYYSPARLIGGDYYDYIPLPGKRLAITLGDVSGKGIAAALLMARLSATVRFSFALEASPALAIAQVNRSMMQADAEHFVTFVAAFLDPETYALTLVNAGHPPFLRRRGVTDLVTELGNTEVGLPLGLFDRPYEETHLTLEPGDSLVLYTDGITEARNPSGDFYGVERLRQLVHNAPETAQGLGEAILEDVRRFAAGRPQSDDITLVCITRSARAGSAIRRP
jgi:serine phosphatase RsbU (regulator of sigma subunit)/pSer/pThr/pTyr-binding forkhead associated (FHA) protein